MKINDEVEIVNCDVKSLNGKKGKIFFIEPDKITYWVHLGANVGYKFETKHLRKWKN